MVRVVETAALIVSAGVGRRLGGHIPKQYLPFSEKTVLYHSVAAFVRHKDVDAVRVVIHPEHEEFYRRSIEGLEVLPAIFGGAERQDSVRRGLQSFVELAPKRVLIHDAARPRLSKGLVSAVLAEVHPGQGALPGLTITDTVKSVDDGGYVTGTLERSGIWRVQTPQAFMFRDILSAHVSAEGKSLTDDAAIAESIGIKIKVVPGDPKNIKITYPTDVEGQKENERPKVSSIRVGNGFDVHRFGEGNSITLCGVQIPFNKSLEGHSDADVGYHAITDALLGAAGQGDIGKYFPPSDKKWRDAPSDTFLKHAGELVKSVGAMIENVDLTIICESPRIGPHREEMETSVAKCLSLELDRVNIKGKTTEKLGFLGREEGIAAQAVVTININ